MVGAGRRRSLIAGVVLLAVIVVLCAIVPVISRYSPDALVATPDQPPSTAHLFGTDSFGRDLFVRVFAAGRIDLFVAWWGLRCRWCWAR